MSQINGYGYGYGGGYGYGDGSGNRLPQAVFVAEYVDEDTLLPAVFLSLIPRN